VSGMCNLIAYLPNVMFTDECGISQCMVSNVYMWAKQNPYFFEEVSQHSPHVMMWARHNSELIIISNN
jgi:hypothetical protein